MIFNVFTRQSALMQKTCKTEGFFIVGLFAIWRHCWNN